MDLNSLKSFAVDSRKKLLKSVSLKIEYVLSKNSRARRENPKVILDLENKIKSSSKENIIEQVSYTWFNRFIALQYMDIKGFNDVQVILPRAGQTRPEILSNAISGVFDNTFISENTQNIVLSLLDGRSASNDPEKDAYKLLLISVCNKFHSMMPFLFERIADYTELLIPDDLLSKTSILAKIREIMSKDNCQEIEVIGWLYQFYISDKKDEVFLDLKKNKKIASKNIPAATQLFTPNWIVKYLAENSLGRLWMLNNPNSDLIKKMSFYIPPSESENDFLKINSPEEIKICDPACGSGHMLTYSFDLLYSIYQEEGYAEDIIPNLILKNNLYGIEIDKRAGDLAAFSLSIKAREKQSSFFHNPVQPNICVLENINFEEDEIDKYMFAIGRDLFTDPLKTTLKQFEESDNLGTLIEPFLEDIESIKEKILLKDISGDLFLGFIHNKVIKVLNYCEYLKKKYHIIISNPPYMGLKGMNLSLSRFAQNNYADSKLDLFAMFMERTLRMNVNNGILAMINMQSWMFLSSYAKLRSKLLSNTTLLNMAHIGTRGFDTIGGEVVSTTAFIINKKYNPDFKGEYLRLTDGKSELEKSKMIDEAIHKGNSEFTYRVSKKHFDRIPGKPIAYWVSEKEISKYSENNLLKKYANPKKGIDTGENEKFVRLWYEVSKSSISIFQGKKWFPYNKGGPYRKWYGNRDYLVNWENNGRDIKSRSKWKSKKPTIRNSDYFFKEGFSWTTVSPGEFSARYSPPGCMFDSGGNTLFADRNIMILGAFLNSKVINRYLDFLAPTVNFQPGDIGNVLYLENCEKLNCNTDKLIELSKEDWDSCETSFDFKTLKILSIYPKSKLIEEQLILLEKHWEIMISKMINLEEENNKQFIKVYQLEDVINEEINLKDLSLRCNSEFRYKKLKLPSERIEKLLEDTIKEFISYSVGCMFGRYSLDEPGLIISNQGETIENYLRRVPNPSFIPDDDNIIPLLELDWFEDDITARFKKFLKVTFGEENFEENLRFIENKIGKNIRKYFLSEFYKDHSQKYKKRPIYWMFSSPKGSFNALIYLHRYQIDTVSIILEKYLSEFLLKLRAKKNTLERIDHNSSSREKNKALKEIQKIDNIISELQNWIKEVIFPLASQRLEIELDDGVKFNYQKFGSALKKVSGLN